MLFGLDIPDRGPGAQAPADRPGISARRGADG
jgi:hypothetical protein